MVRNKNNFYCSPIRVIGEQSKVQRSSIEKIYEKMRDFHSRKKGFILTFLLFYGII